MTYVLGWLALAVVIVPVRLWDWWRGPEVLRDPREDDYIGGDEDWDGQL